jgi:hypothetical protein
MPAACTSPSWLDPPTRLAVENSPVFFLLFTGRPIFALAAVVPIRSFKGPIRCKTRRLEKKPRFGAHAASGLFWPAEPKGHPSHQFGQTNPRGSPVTPVAKRTRGAPSRDFGQTNPSGRPVRVFAKRTRGRPSRSSFRERTQGAAQCRFELNERTRMSLLTPSS